VLSLQFIGIIKIMRIFLFIFFQLLVVFVSAQITNTRKWRVTERDSLDNALFLYEEKNYSMALPIFEKVNVNHPKEDFIKYLYGICCLYRSDKHNEALNALADVYAINTGIDMIEYDLARAYHYNYKFDEAIDFLNKHLSYKRIRPDDKANALLLKQYITNAKFYYSNPTKAKINNIGSIINSDGDEFSPAITIDEEMMVFNYAGTKSKGGKLNARLQPDENGVYTSDIYISPKQNGDFKAANALDNINTNGNDVALSLSQDGQILFTYVNVIDGHGDIYASYLNGDNYSQPAKLKGRVNTYSWDGGCSLSPDGKTLYFASERSGGYGGKDIYSAKLLADSTWGKVVNLGDSINTPYDEDSPFIHADGTTLFYSSKCLKSCGGYDVFKSIMNTKDSTFKKTESLGYPINTPDDDINFVLNANGLKGYYSSGKKGGSGLQDIYSIETGFGPDLSKLLLLKGTISKNSNPIDAEIKIEITSNNNLVYKNFKSNKGSYLVSLPLGYNYKVSYISSKLPTQTITLTTVGYNGFLEKTQNVNFDPITEVVKTVTTPAAITTTTIAPATVINVSPTISVTKTLTTVPVVVAKVVTPTVIATPTAAVRSSSVAVTKIVPSNFYTTSTVVVTSPTVASSKTITSSNASLNTLENFIPKTPAQEKVKAFTDKYPDISADSLEFRVQIAACKNPKNYEFPHLIKYGPIENLLLLDGITRITAGGKFKTLRKAYEHNKKVVIAGQNDAFVAVIYKGKRISLDDLVTMGIFK
jgi:tetratricopeptide (TPR) repeat protein